MLSLRHLAALSLTLAPLAACGLAVGGPPLETSDGGDAAIDVPPPTDQGTGHTESGAVCSCLKDVPGWTYVAFNSDQTTTPCPPEFGMQKFHVEGITNIPPTCDCKCNKTSDGTCTPSSIGFKGGNGSCNDVSQTITGNGPCYDVNPDYNSPNSGNTFVGGSVTATPTGGTCDPVPTIQIPPVLPAHSGETCALTGGLGSGCAANFDCVPVAASPFQVCVYSATQMACPPEYPAAHLIGDAKNDDRNCSGTCSCTPAVDCSSGTIELFSDNQCNNTLSITEPIGNNACTATNQKNLQIHAVKLSMAQKTTCNPTTLTPVGSARLEGPHTVCCLQ